MLPARFGLHSHLQFIEQCEGRVADFVADDHRHKEGSSHLGDASDCSRLGTGPDEVQSFGEAAKPTDYYHPAVRRFATAGREPEQVLNTNHGSRQRV